MRAARASYERAEAQVAQAEASIQESEGVLGQTVARAPISGRVGQRNAEVGMRVDGSTRLFTIGRLDEVRVEVPVTQEMIARFQEGQTVETIITDPNHINGQRITYSANLEEGVALGEAVERVRAELSGMQLPGDFSIVYGGAYREQQEVQRDFVIAILMALVLVYMVMAGQFERFLDPLIVMCSVPAALIGVIPTMLITGTTLNVQSIMGLVMLIGIVVNNAIVLVDYINLMRRERGLPVQEAVVEAARLRLRPILMTTLTTVLALMPLALGWGVGASLQASLARVVGGLTASTLVTLLLIPTLYVSATLGVEKAKAFARDRFNLGGSSAAPQPAG